MNFESARLLLKADTIAGEAAFDLIDFAHRYWQNERNEPLAVDLLVRLAAKREVIEDGLNGASAMIDDVLRFAGLFPYIDGRDAHNSNYVKSLMRLPSFPKITFHKGQLQALEYLLEGRSLILSAPTSFGKSLLVDVTLRTRKPKTAVIVVPTLALLDEYRKRLKHGFPDYQIITKSSEIPTGSNVIFLGTQERIEDREEIKNVGLFVIDEFYKLDLRRKDERAASLNNVMSIYASRAKQVYLLGPSIASIDSYDTEAPSNISFLKSNFSPVATDVIRVPIGSKENKDEKLKNLLGDLNRRSTLVYLRSPPATYKCGLNVIIKRGRSTGISRDLANWVRENYHSKWILADCLDRNVGIHHGRIPRALAQYQISLFNEGHINTILCTSSMIEGVNTRAENVIIFDNFISKDKLDRFTFDNIKGRAGRMFQHFVGNVFLFGDAPLGDEPTVEIPLFNGFENASDEVIVSVPEVSLSATAKRRKDFMLSRSLLAPDLLRKWGRYGVNGLNDLARELRERRRDPLLIWSGQGTYEQLRETFELVWKHLNFSKHGMRSGQQAAFYTTRLRSSGSIKSFLEGLAKDPDRLRMQTEIDLGLNFIRAAEYTLPQLLIATQDIADYFEIDLDYSIPAGRLPMLFLSGDYHSMEENGLPLPTARKLRVSASSAVDAVLYNRLLLQISDPIDRDLFRRWGEEELSLD